MLRSRFAPHACALLGLILGSGLAAAEAGTPPTGSVGLAIQDFTYLDTSGEPADQTAAHRKRLQALNTAFRGDFSADRQYHLVPVPCGPGCADDGAMSADLVGAASDAGAKILVIGAVHKLSTLVQNAKIVAIDVETKRVVLERLFTFRGDNDEAWRRAEMFMSKEVREILANHQPAAPIDLAIFDFELEDASAGAAASGDSAADKVQLAGVTSTVRELFAQSGRYRLIDVGSADAAAVKAHELRECNGCEAGIALKLGAQQSFVGVVRRISRTEYTVRFQLRDAATGAVVSEQDSGLRMGADYSWNRGAARLVRERLLESPGQR